MFFVLSRKKMCSYLIAIGTVAILFSVAGEKRNEKLVETSANIYENNSINYIENEENN